MPEIALQAVVSATSSDPRHRAENLLQPDSGGHWRSAAAGEKQISVVLQLAREQRIHSVHIGNDGAAFVEVLVGAAAGGDFQVLLPTAAFLSPGESRAGTGLQRVRLFGPEALLKAAAERAWDRVRVVCSQPYCQTRPFGLSFVRFFSPPEGDEAAAEPPVTRLGHFTVREDGGSPRRPGALFYKRPPSPQVPPQDTPGPSYAVATLQATSSDAPPPAPRPPKLRLPPHPQGRPGPRHGGGAGGPRLDLGLPAAAAPPALRPVSHAPAGTRPHRPRPHRPRPHRPRPPGHAP